MNPVQYRLESPNVRPSRLGRRAASSASKTGLIILTVAGSILGAAPRASAQPGGALKEVGFDQNLNAQIPLTTKFRDENGQTVQLADFFGKRPVILVMGYSNCPLLCSKVLGEVTRSLKPLEPSIGKDFDIVTVSINPKETPEQADSMRRNYLKRYNRPGLGVGLARLDRRRAFDHWRWPRPWGSATRTARSSTSTPTPRGSSCSRPPGGSRATSTGSSIPPESSSMP